MKLDRDPVARRSLWPTVAGTAKQKGIRRLAVPASFMNSQKGAILNANSTQCETLGDSTLKTMHGSLYVILQRLNSKFCRGISRKEAHSKSHVAKLPRFVRRINFPNES